MNQEEIIIIISVAGFLVLAVGFFVSYLIELKSIRRDWKQLCEQLDARFKALAAEHGTPFIPVVSTEFIPAAAPRRHSIDKIGPSGRMSGEVALNDNSRCLCEIISFNELTSVINVSRTIPRRGQLQDLGFSLTPEGMMLSLKGRVYPLSPAQTEVWREQLDLEPWPSTLKSFTYDSVHIELTLEASLREAKSPEVIARFDELWAQSRGYFERFLQTDIDHSKASQLEAALALDGALTSVGA